MNKTAEGLNRRSVLALGTAVAVWMRRHRPAVLSLEDVFSAKHDGSIKPVIVP